MDKYCWCLGTCSFSFLNANRWSSLNLNVGLHIYHVYFFFWWFNLLTTIYQSRFESLCFLYFIIYGQPKAIAWSLQHTFSWGCFSLSLIMWPQHFWVFIWFSLCIWHNGSLLPWSLWALDHSPFFFFFLPPVSTSDLLCPLSSPPP